MAATVLKMFQVEIERYINEELEALSLRKG